jgi:23S rRNA (cytidine1920-2'-O)/16S rRNA (cytidine1409-2'-O)-methyltransferase
VADSRVRLDVLLVKRGLAETREKAQALILAGEVLVAGQTASRAAQPYAPDVDLAIKRPLPYVSRGGLKLERALDSFGIDPSGLTVLDVGASTGGFTDCLLKRGARRVYAVDVGYNQLDWRLRQDERVVVMERTNIRGLSSLPEPVDAIVADVSFISLTVALPPALPLLKAGGWVVALVKPQFEAGRGQVGKGGVVRDPAIHRAVLTKALNWGRSSGLIVRGAVPSPIRGPAGNVEFLIHLVRSASAESEPADAGRPVEELVEECLASVGTAVESG